MAQQLLNTPFTADYVTADELKNFITLDKGGIVSSEFGAYQVEFDILSGNFKQSNSKNVENYSSRNAFIQAEEAVGGTGNSYGPAYSGTKGYCILSVMANTNQIMLSGDASAIANIFDDSKTTIAEKYPYVFPQESRAVRILNGKAPGTALTVADLKNLYYSFSLDSNAGTRALRLKSVTQYSGVDADPILSNGYAIVSVDSVPSLMASAMPANATMADYVDRFLNDDNALYCTGFPELGNVIIENFYGQHAEGGSIRAIGKYSHAEGRDTIADVRYSHAEGSHNVAGNMASHAEGFYNLALGRYAHAEGTSTVAFGQASHAAGRNANANEDYSYVWNQSTTPYPSHGTGTYNINPINNLSGLFIGSRSLHDILNSGTVSLNIYDSSNGAIKINNTVYSAVGSYVINNVSSITVPGISDYQSDRSLRINGFPIVDDWGVDRTYLIKNDCTIEYESATCLSPDTKILMDDFMTSKELRNVEVGDKIAAIDPATGELTSDTVSEVSFGVGTATDIWIFDDETEIKTVGRHRFYNLNLGEMMYLEAWNLNEHAININKDKVKLIRHDHIEGNAEHGTLFTEKFNNYFANGLLAGNRRSVKLTI